MFAADATKEKYFTGLVAPFLTVNNLSSGSVLYEVHQENSSRHTLSLVNSIINGHENTSLFSSSWLLVATWKSIKQHGTSNVSVSGNNTIFMLMCIFHRQTLSREYWLQISPHRMLFLHTFVEI